MCKPKVKKYKVDPYVPPAPPAPPADPAELDIKSKSKTSSAQKKKRKGKSNLRTDLSVNSGTSGASGLKIPTK